MQRKLILNEAFSYNASDFTSGEGTTGQEVFNLLQNKDYQKAIKEASLADLPKVIEVWLNEQLPGAFHQIDDKVVNLVTSWVNAFDRNIDYTHNPFISYLEFCNERGLDLTYDSLVTVNNKYNEGVLTNQDLYADNVPLIMRNNNFYDETTYKQQEDLIDWWVYLKDKNNVDKLLKSVGDDENIFSSYAYPKKYILSRDGLFRNLLFYNKPKPRDEDNLRKYDDIVKIIDILNAYNSQNKSSVKNMSRDEMRDVEDLIREKGLSLKDLRAIATYFNTRGK